MNDVKEDAVIMEEKPVIIDERDEYTPMDAQEIIAVTMIPAILKAIDEKQPRPRTSSIRFTINEKWGMFPVELHYTSLGWNITTQKETFFLTVDGEILECEVTDGKIDEDSIIFVDLSDQVFRPLIGRKKYLNPSRYSGGNNLRPLIKALIGFAYYVGAGADVESWQHELAKTFQFSRK